ncbi:MAG: hypothetical protein Q9164_003639 [Protoblastenia rupestris]
MSRNREAHQLRQLWERNLREQRLAANAEFEENRQRNLREELSSLNSLRATLSSTSSQHKPISRDHVFRNRTDLPELDGEHQMVRERASTDLPTPPLSHRSSHSSPSDTIRDLCADVERQKGYIAELETNLDKARKEVERLQHERRATVKEKKDAILKDHHDKVASLEEKIKALAQMLDESTEREEDLMTQIAESRVREQALEKQLHEAQINSQRDQSNSKAAQARHESLRQKLDDAEYLESDFERYVNNNVQRRQSDIRRMQNRNRYRETVKSTEREVCSASSLPSKASGRSRKHAKAMEKNGYVDLPSRQGGGRSRFVL